MATPRRDPYAWVTWLTPTLAGDAQCLWAPWFQAHYTFDKLERGDFDLAKWKVEHNAMVAKRATALTEGGWQVYLEDQNQFRLKGKTITVAGKPDIVAVRDTQAIVIDEKGGKRRDSDVQQVLLYLLALPLTHPAVNGKTLRGEVEYRDGILPIPTTAFTETERQRLVATIRRIGEATPPARVPSARECGFCDIAKTDCPDRIERATETVETADF